MFFIDPNECINWHKAKLKAGYGLIKADGKLRMVHRFFFEQLTSSKLKRTDFVCHTCNNPSCFNPHHLYLGNGTTNAKDRIKAGTVRNGSSKLEVREKIRLSLLGKKHTDERKKNQSIAQKSLYASGYINPRKLTPNPFTGTLQGVQHGLSFKEP